MYSGIITNPHHYASFLNEKAINNPVYNENGANQRIPSGCFPSASNCRDLKKRHLSNHSTTDTEFPKEEIKTVTATISLGTCKARNI
jgi:hypothetical protein